MTSRSNSTMAHGTTNQNDRDLAFADTPPSAGAALAAEEAPPNEEDADVATTQPSATTQPTALTQCGDEQVPPLREHPERGREIEQADSKRPSDSKRTKNSDSHAAVTWSVSNGSGDSNRRRDPIDAARAFVFLTQLSAEEMLIQSEDSQTHWLDAQRLMDFACDCLLNALSQRGNAISAQYALGRADRLERLRQPSYTAQPSFTVQPSYAAPDYAGHALVDCWARADECRRALLTLGWRKQEEVQQLIGQLMELYTLLGTQVAN